MRAIVQKRLHSWQVIHYYDIQSCAYLIPISFEYVANPYPLAPKANSPVCQQSLPPFCFFHLAGGLLVGDVVFVRLLVHSSGSLPTSAPAGVQTPAHEDEL
jgi:hypothetical protein